MAMVLLSLVFSLATTAPATTDYVRLSLAERVRLSDTIVLARVTDPSRALVSVERILKGAPDRQIKLVSFVDTMASSADWKLLVLDARELLFLNKEGNAYAPLQTQYGRFPVDGDRLTHPSTGDQQGLGEILASIERLVAFQARAARTGAEADAAYVDALRNADVEVQRWALGSVKDQKAPSQALVDAILARWSGTTDSQCSVAGAVVAWRLERLAPFFAGVVTTSGNANERACAAMALGGTGNRTYLPVLRRAAQDADPKVRALAYSGIMSMIGPEALDDLRRGSKDADERVRAQTVVDAYNLLERGQPNPRWPPASRALVAEVRAFLTAMQRDPVRLVSQNAKYMLAMLDAPRLP